MSGWVLLVRELYARGPLLEREFETLVGHGAMLGLTTYMQHAAKLGLVERPGRHSGPPRPYKLTAVGRDFCEGRITFSVRRGLPPGPNGGRAKGSTLQPRLTWLSALPRANEVRLSEGCGQAATR